jgi:hypothetical protein
MVAQGLPRFRDRGSPACGRCSLRIVGRPVPFLWAIPPCPHSRPTMLAVTIRFASRRDKRRIIGACPVNAPWWGRLRPHQQCPGDQARHGRWGDFRESSFANCVISGCHYGLCAMVASSTASITWRTNCRCKPAACSQREIGRACGSCIIWSLRQRSGRNRPP